MGVKVPNFRARVMRVAKRETWLKIAEAIKALWISEVMKSKAPRAWKMAYIRFIRIESTEEKGCRVVFDPGNPRTLKGSEGRDALFARALERGIPGGGIHFKDILLAGRDHVNIPIEHSKMAVNKYAGVKRGQPSEVWGRLQALDYGKRMPAGTVARLRVEPLPGAHVTDPLDGAYRSAQAFVRKANQVAGTEKRTYGHRGTVMTFRRITSNTDDNKWVWMRQGVAGQHPSRRVRKQIPALVKRLLEG